MADPQLKTRALVNRSFSTVPHPRESSTQGHSLLRPHSVPSRGFNKRWATVTNATKISRRTPVRASRRASRARPDDSTSARGGRVSAQDWHKVHTVHQAVYKDSGATREHPRARLQRILGGLRIIVGFCLALKRYAVDATDLEQSLKDLELGLSSTGGFNFDLNLDRLKETGTAAQPLKHLGQRLRSILYIPPEKRSIEDVRKIFVYLRTLSTFRFWTIPVLLNFCRYAVYQKYEPKQVVLRRGHNPEGYYIILSGTVLVNNWSHDEGTGDTKHRVFEQTCGEVFGESELQDNTPRRCTVVCRTECELLTATREDYLEVVAGPLHKIMDENIEFLRGLGLFRHFPCEKLTDSLAEFETKLYSKDSVVVPSMDYSDTMIVIKTGKCKVVGEIRRPAVPCRRPPVDPQLSAIFPEEHKRRLANVDSDDRLSSLDLEWETGQMRGVMRANLVIGVKEPEKLVVSVGAKPPVSTSQNISKKVESWMLSRPGLSNKLQVIRSHTDMPIQVTKPKEQPRERFTNSAEAKAESDETKASMMSGISRRIKRISKMAQLQEQKQRELDARPKPQEDEYSQQFVLLDRLGPGAVFGLESIFLKSPIKLSLVSEGAECISISKKFFIKESNTDVMKAASDVIIRYPTSHYVQTQVRDRRAWTKYKQQIIRDVTTPKRTKKFTIT